MYAKNSRLLEIQRYIFWIDQDMEKDEIQKCSKVLKSEFPFYEIETFISMKSYESFLKKEKEKYDFKLIYYIVSGELAEKFFESYNSQLHNYIIAATIIYCGNKNYYSSKPYANNLYLNPGGVVTNFNEVLKYIRSENDILWYNLVKINKSNFVLPEEKKNFRNTFVCSKSLTDIALPLILTEIIKQNLIQNIDIINFMNYIFSKYSDYPKIISLVKPSLEKNIDLLLKKRVLFFLKLYTLETPFYSNLNKELTNIESFEFYKAYIIILYYSIQNKIVENYCSGKLYRCSLMSINEIEEIIKNFENKKANIKNKNEMPSIFCYSKPFMSFCKHKSFARKYVTRILDNTVRVTFILNPPKHSGEIYYSNIDIDKLKILEFDESEVLLLPLSCFEIENYKRTGECDYEIILNYLDKYYHQLKNNISIIKNNEQLQDFCEKILESPFSKKVIECLEDSNTIINNIKDYIINHSPNKEIILNDIQKLSHEKKLPKFNENCIMEKINKFYSL